MYPSQDRSILRLNSLQSVLIATSCQLARWWPMSRRRRVNLAKFGLIDSEPDRLPGLNYKSSFGWWMCFAMNSSTLKNLWYTDWTSFFCEYGNGKNMFGQWFVSLSHPTCWVRWCPLMPFRYERGDWNNTLMPITEFNRVQGISSFIFAGIFQLFGIRICFVTCSAESSK